MATPESTIRAILSQSSLGYPEQKLLTDSIVGAEKSSSVVAVGNTVASQPLNFSRGSFFTATLAVATTTFSFTNVPSGVVFSYIVLAQDATGGRLVTWPGAVAWSAATAPTLTTAANKIDVFKLTTYNGGTKWFAETVGLNYT